MCEKNYKWFWWAHTTDQALQNTSTNCTNCTHAQTHTVAMLVPLISEVAVSPFQDVLVMLLPGAKRDRH